MGGLNSSNEGNEEETICINKMANKSVKKVGDTMDPIKNASYVFQSGQTTIEHKQG